MTCSSFVGDIINHGSPYLAFEANVITVEGMLLYLESSDYSTNNMIALKAMYDLNPHQRHLIISRISKLANTKCFGVVYQQLLKHIVSEDLPATHIHDDVKCVLGITNYNSYTDYSCIYKSLINTIKGRSVKNYHIKFIKFFKNFSKSAIDSDSIIYFNQFVETQIDLSDVLKRCQYLSTIIPEYWDKVAKAHYKIIIDQCIKKDVAVALDPALNELFGPSDKKENVSKILESTWIMMDNYKQAYILGYPIHMYLPSQSVIDREWKQLKNSILEGNLEKYFESFPARQQETMEAVIKTTQPRHHVKIVYDDTTPSLDCTDVSSFKLYNTENVLMESVFEYSPFDTIYLVVDRHVYVFNRPEFITMHKSGKNPYTNEPLPISVIHQINSRIITARELGLMDSEPLIDICKNIKAPNYSKTPSPKLNLNIHAYAYGAGPEFNYIYPNINISNYNERRIGNLSSLFQMEDVPLTEPSEDLHPAGGHVFTRENQWRISRPDAPQDGNVPSLRIGGVPLMDASDDTYSGENSRGETYSFTQHDVDLVILQTGAPTECVINTLMLQGGDIVNAIMELTNVDNPIMDMLQRDGLQDVSQEDGLLIRFRGHIVNPFLGVREYLFNEIMAQPDRDDISDSEDDESSLMEEID